MVSPRRLLFWTFLVLTLVSLALVGVSLVQGSRVPVAAWLVLFASTGWAFLLRPRPPADDAGR